MFFIPLCTHLSIHHLYISSQLGNLGSKFSPKIVFRNEFQSIPVHLAKETNKKTAAYNYPPFKIGDNSTERQDNQKDRRK